MMKNYIARAEKFATFANKPVLFIEDPFEKTDSGYWFVCDDWRPFNPSSHIHYCELKGRNINDLMNQTDEYDQFRFITRLDDVQLSHISFSNVIKWILIRPIQLRY